MRYFILNLNREPVSCTRDVWRNTYPHCGTISRRLSYLAEDVELHTQFHSCTEAENDPPCLWETTAERYDGDGKTVGVFLTQTHSSEAEADEFHQRVALKILDDWNAKKALICPPSMSLRDWFADSMIAKGKES